MASEEAATAAPGATADDVLLSRLISHMQGGDAEPSAVVEQPPDAHVPAPAPPAAPAPAPVPAPAPAKDSKISDQDIEVDGNDATFEWLFSLLVPFQKHNRRSLNHTLASCSFQMNHCAGLSPCMLLC